LEQEQIDIANAPVAEERQNSPMDVAAANSSNVREPGLVEKLMQQLNDLKEMVCVKYCIVYLVINNIINNYTIILIFLYLDI